jgi:hypothetical protein
VKAEKIISGVNECKKIIHEFIKYNSSLILISTGKKRVGIKVNIPENLLFGFVFQFKNGILLKSPTVKY